jgi:exo-beta-1,3-glucanase (GH17 family)
MKYCIAMLLFALLTTADISWGDENPAILAPVWIYRDMPAAGEKDTRTETERIFSPGGFMPAERVNQIRVTADRLVDPDKSERGTCIEYLFEIKKPDDWVGVYTLIDGDKWGTKVGLSIPKLMKIPGHTRLALRFRVRGEGVVTFKTGGITKGKFPSSLKFAVEPAEGSTVLTGDFKEMSIPLQARQLTNLIDPICVVCTAMDNRDREIVRVEIDDVRIEAFERPTELKSGWQKRLRDTLLITYTPTGFDPTSKPVKQPTVANIREDLLALRRLADGAGIKGRNAGVILYGCRDGLEHIPSVLVEKEINFSMILGIFNPSDKTEVDNAITLLCRADLKDAILGICIGNESITFRRADLDTIVQVASRLRTIGVATVPTCSTEVVQAYGNRRMFTEFDFTLANVHALFAEVYDAKDGGKWAIERIRDLREEAPPEHPIVIKELGWPSGPAPFTAEQQKEYWELILANDIAKQVNIAVFDSFANVGWKREMIKLPGGASVNVGPYWPVLFDNHRKATEYAPQLLQRWKAAQNQGK